MKKINPYAISHFQYGKQTLFILSNIDEFEVPFVRIIDDKNYCDITISDSPTILDANFEYDIKKISAFILKYKKILLEHWDFKIYSTELVEYISNDLK